MIIAPIDFILAGALTWGATRFVTVSSDRKTTIYGGVFLVFLVAVNAFLNSSLGM